MGRPSHCLYCCDVVCEFDEGLGEMRVPDQESVVVAAGTELLFIDGPFQAADLLLVAVELLYICVLYS